MYKDYIGLGDNLNRIAGIKGLTIVELCYSQGLDESNSEKVEMLLEDHGLQAPVVNVPLVGSKDWMFNSISAAKEDVRDKASNLPKEQSNSERKSAQILSIYSSARTNSIIPFRPTIRNNGTPSSIP